MIGHRPSRRTLEAWFDGEREEDLGPHVATCRRCQQRLSLLRGVRGVLRGTAPAPAASPATAAVAVPTRRPRFALVAVAVVAAAVLLGAAANQYDVLPSVPLAGRAAVNRRQSAVTDRAALPPGTTAAPAPSSTRAPAQGQDQDQGQQSASPAVSAGRTSSLPAVPPHTSPLATPSASRSLHVATVVPLSGPQASDGQAAAAAVRHVIDAANLDGGIGGKAIELRIVAADDRAEVDALNGWADAVVGGFGGTVPTQLTWLLPADPAAKGANIVAGEPDAARAGGALRADVDRAAPADHSRVSEAPGAVGAIVAPGPESGIARAFADRPGTVTTALTAGSTCDKQVLQLQRAKVAALLLATGPADAARCADAAARIAWRPAGGILVAPSVAYAFGDAVPLSLIHARTALGFPWPSSQSAGAARFRAAMPGVVSYRALVSFAAAELVVTAARAASSLTVAAISAATWQTDLVMLDHGANTGTAVVSADGRGWNAA